MKDAGHGCTEEAWLRIGILEDIEMAVPMSPSQRCGDAIMEFSTFNPKGWRMFIQDLIPGSLATLQDRTRKPLTKIR